jgi:phage terminase large subunit GpA-like protein
MIELGLNIWSDIENQEKVFASEYLNNLEIKSEISLPIEWAAEKRYFPPGTSEMHGHFRKETAPHLEEILNRIHPDDPCTHITCMKSVQSCLTTTVGENAIGFWIDEKLGSVLFLTSSKGIGKIRSSSAFDVMVDYSDLKLSPLSSRMKNKTADTSNYKEFAGGVKFLITSYNSIADLKSNTFHLIVEDEWDEAPPELKGQGDVAGIIEGRTMGVRNYKILKLSTPSNMATSRIYKDFKAGDQRYYNMPCPECGELQVLVLKGGGLDYGLTFTREKNKRTGKKIMVPESVRYVCQHCKKEFYESKKQWMLQNGVWIPTATPDDPLKTSYHVSGFLSPETFLSWRRICQSFINTEFGEDLLKYKDFMINIMGNPWKSVKKAASWEVVRDQAEDYCFGEVPPGEEKVIDGEVVYFGGLILHAGIDVQADRLEICVVASGPLNNKFIVDYQIFFGRTDQIDDPCWRMLEEWVYSHAYVICGKEYTISLAAIDTGWDPRKGKREKDFAGKSHIVYEFVSQRTDKFIAVISSPKADFSKFLVRSPEKTTRRALCALL